jgi:integrase
MRPNDTKKPDKPRDDFPLYAHGSGRWAKKIRQKLHYFGPWSDPQAALEKWLREKDYLLAGKKPPAQHDPDALTIKRLCDLFCESVERKVETGERSRRTLDGYVENAKRIADYFGRTTAVEFLTPQEFAAFRSHLAKGVNVKTLEGRIACSRAVFNYGMKNGLINRPLPKIWGTEFEKPDKAALSKEKNKVERLFSADEIRQLLDAADGQLKAMILFGINGGLGPTDIAMIRFDDIRDGWLTLARNKTGKARRIPLWKETIDAIEQAKEKRPTPKDEADSDVLFITKYKRNWLPDRKRFPLSAEFAKLQKQTGITGKGKSFYTLRHTLQTVGDETKDFIAVSAIMGHIDQTISVNYRERIGDDRLQAVTDHVRQWLFPKAKKIAKTAPKKAAKRSGKGGAK